MAKRKKDTMEFRFYELPQGESALVLCGESWKRVYGHEEFHLHFHNLLEIGICREGDGNMYLDEDIYQYHDGDITFIPENFPHVTVSYGEVVNFWEYIFIDLRSVIEEMFPNNAVFQNDAVSTISKKAFMTNVYQSPVVAEYINAIIRETSEHKIYCQRTEKLLVQGVIDLFYLDSDGRLVLCDYKTDRLSAAERRDPALAARRLTALHSAQLGYYAEAISQIMGRRPDKVIIYSLCLGDSIEVRF